LAFIAFNLTSREGKPKYKSHGELNKRVGVVVIMLITISMVH